MLVVVVVVVTLPMSMAMVFVIFGFRKKSRLGFRRLLYAATAKFLGASSRISQKMNVGRCNFCYR